jgi:hypothetical protein
MTVAKLNGQVLQCSGLAFANVHGSGQVLSRCLFLWRGLTRRVLCLRAVFGFVALVTKVKK